MSNVIFTNEVDPATPSSGKTKLWVDTDKHIKTIDDAGTVTDLVVAGTDEKVKVSSNDTTAKYLEDSITGGAGTGIAVSTLNDGSDEDVQVKVDISQETSATVASGDLLLIEDVDDSNNLKKVTAGDIAALASPAGNSFETIIPTAGTSPVADSATDTLTLTATNIVITGDSSTDTLDFAIADTAVTPASYGSASQVATFTVDQQGRLTAAADTAISVTSSAVSDFNEAAQDAVGGILTDSSSIDFTYTDGSDQITAAVIPGGVDHNSLANLTTGDVHTQYTKLAGRSGGQNQIGGIGSGDNLTLESTSHATKGKIIFGGASGTTAFDGVNKRFGIGTASPSAFLHVSPAAGTGTVVPGVTLTGGAHTALTASTERFDVNINGARTVQWATGALTTQRFNVFQAPTMAFVGASTVTTAATLAVTGAPVKGTNATLTSTYGILVQAGAVSTATSAYGIGVSSPTGATNNYAAKFDNITVATNTIAASNTNGGLIIAPNGTGNIQTRSSGNTRGIYSVDLQSYVGTTAQVASGQYSNISGGYANTSSSTGSAVVGGTTNTASNTYAIAGGQLSTASGAHSVALGYSCTASASGAISLGIGGTSSATLSGSIGYNNNVSGDFSGGLFGGNNIVGSQYSVSVGGAYAAALYKFSRITGFQVAPLNGQEDVWFMVGSTSSGDGTSFVELTSPERFDGFTSGNVYIVDVRIGGFQTDLSNGGYYHRKAMIKNDSGTVSLLGSVQTIGTDIETDSAWDVQLTADNTNKGLKIEVKSNSQSVYWVAHINSVLFYVGIL